MTEVQQSLVGYKSRVVEGTAFADPNKGKALLNSDDEYVFRLTKIPHVVKQLQTKKKDGVEIKVPVEKVVVEWEEQTTKNIVVSFFRVDAVNFSDDESFESAVVRFFKKIKVPLPEHSEINWENHFVVGMRFRGRVIVKSDVDKDNLPVVKYYLDIPTCRKLLPSDITGESPVAESTKPAPPASGQSDILNACLIAKGAKDSHEALQKLRDANASKELTMAFFNADLSNQIKYPI